LKNPVTLAEARAALAADRSSLVARGVILGEDAIAYFPDSWREDPELAMDALPTLTTASNSAIPAFLTTIVDPEVVRILFAPNKAAIIMGGEVKKGTWVDDTAMFPVVEHVGEVSSYNDYATAGNANVNMNFPQRQSYVYQTVKQYGEREIERVGKAKIALVSEIDASAATLMSKYQNLSYFYGIAGLQNYGLLNEPNLTATLTPATKAAGGTAWVNASRVVVATANEIYTDIQSLFNQLVFQSGGIIEAEDPMTLALSPVSAVGLTATNSFNVNVHDLLKKNFPNIKIVTAVQYGVLSTSNPQGVAAGNMVQLIAPKIEGKQALYPAYSEKMRNHAIIRDLSSFKQKVSGGTWGAIIRYPLTIAGMVGI